METSTRYFNNKQKLWIYFLLIISSTLPALLAVKNIKVATDSMIYALISQEILSGNGIASPIIGLEGSYVFNNGIAPYIEQPPLFPIFLGLLGGVTPNNLLAAQIINATSHVAIAIFTFLLMKKMYDNSSTAFLTGMLVSISFPILWNTNRVLSESLFIAFTAAAIYFLILSRHFDSNKSIRNLFVASICSSLAILTRFPGVALIPAFFWEILILVKNKNMKPKYASVAIATILPIITTGALFIYTYVVSGTIYGWEPPSPGRSYLEAFTVTIKMMFLQFQLGERPLVLITIFAILFIFYILTNINARRELLKYVHSGLDLIIVFIISYIMLITNSMVKLLTVIEVRYMSPLVPFLFIFCIIIIVVMRGIIRLNGFPKLSLCAIILSLGIITFGDCYKTYLNSEELISKQVGHYRILNSPTYNWLKDNYGKNVIITSNRPYHLSFFGGYSTIRLPHRRFNKSYRIPDNMDSFLPDRMSKFGSRVLAIFDEADEQNEGSYITKLFNKREDDDNFVLVQKFPDGVVYNLKK